jgi:hypothetical protein
VSSSAWSAGCTLGIIVLEANLKRLYFSTMLLFVVAAQACGRTQMDNPFPRVSADSAGTGGSAGNGGMGVGLGSGGTGGLDGSGGAGGYGVAGGSGDCPPCLADAFNGCVPAGRCVYEMHGSGMGNGSTACFDNGVRIQRAVGVNGNVVNSRGSASKDGKTCYLWNQTTGSTLQPPSITFTDGAGNQLALGDTDATGATLVDCAGKTYVLSPHCGGWDEPRDCDAGSCP